MVLKLSLFQTAGPPAVRLKSDWCIQVYTVVVIIMSFLISSNSVSYSQLTIYCCSLENKAALCLGALVWFVVKLAQGKHLKNPIQIIQFAWLSFFTCIHKYSFLKQPHRLQVVQTGQSRTCGLCPCNAPAAAHAECWRAMARRDSDSCRCGLWCQSPAARVRASVALPNSSWAATRMRARAWTATAAWRQTWSCTRMTWRLTRWGSLMSSWFLVPFSELSL